MSLVLETGSGVQNANSYVTAAYVTAYLTARSRQTENSWSTLDATAQEAACIAATDYIDRRWGNRFKGTRRTYFDGAPAEATIEFADQPADTETVTVGSYVYTFVSTLSTGLTADFQVLIGADAAETASNLVDALSVDAANAGTTFSDNTQFGNAADAEIDSDTTTQINLAAIINGESGNDIPLSTTATNITVTGFINGREPGVQPLEFPRSTLYNQDGIRVDGVPRNLKDATAEYAVRAASSSLFQDPTVDPSGRAVIRDKVGPLETQFAEGGSLDLLIRPYPGADRLLRDYLKPAGVDR